MEFLRPRERTLRAALHFGWLGFASGAVAGILYGLGGVVVDYFTTGWNHGTVLALNALWAMPLLGIGPGFLMGGIWGAMVHHLPRRWGGWIGGAPNPGWSYLDLWRGYVVFGFFTGIPLGLGYAIGGLIMDVQGGPLGSGTLLALLAIPFMPFYMAAIMALVGALWAPATRLIPTRFGGAA